MSNGHFNENKKGRVLQTITRHKKSQIMVVKTGMSENATNKLNPKIVYLCHYFIQNTHSELEGTLIECPVNFMDFLALKTNFFCPITVVCPFSTNDAVLLIGQNRLLPSA